MNPLTGLQAAVRVKRLQAGLVRVMLRSVESELSELERQARDVQLSEHRWRSLRVDQLEVGDRFRWLGDDRELAVNHVGDAGERIEIGCDGWSGDLLLPRWERVMAHRPTTGRDDNG